MIRKHSQKQCGFESVEKTKEKAKHFRSFSGDADNLKIKSKFNVRDNEKGTVAPEDEWDQEFSILELRANGNQETHRLNWKKIRT